MVSRIPIRPSFSRRSAHFLGIWVLFITQPNASFSFDFGHSVFIEEFGYLGWMVMSFQCKLIDRTDFSPKAKRPNLPKLNNIVDLLAFSTI
jgi:hypothetical protein